MEQIIIRSQQTASGKVDNLIEVADRYKRLYEEASGRLRTATGALAVSHFNALQATQLAGIMANAYFDLSRQYMEKQEKELAALEALHTKLAAWQEAVMEKAMRALESH